MIVSFVANTPHRQRQHLGNIIERLRRMHPNLNAPLQDQTHRPSHRRGVAIVQKEMDGGVVHRNGFGGQPQQAQQWHRWVLLLPGV